jgi:hypothetical protein
VLYFLTLTPMEAPLLASALLSCGYLDAEYLLRLIETYDLDLGDLVADVADYRDGPATVNDLIGVAFERVAQTFLTHVVKRRADRFTSTEYTVWTNCMDS